MSIKIYNGYRVVFDDGFDLLSWQKDLAALRATLKPETEQSVLDGMFRHAISELDQISVGLSSEEPEESPLGIAFSSLMLSIEKARKGVRVPSLDTEVNLSWKLLEDRKTVLCLLYGERPWTTKTAEALGLEDYHYQNQTDPPEDMTEEEFQARGDVWKDAFGGSWGNSPAESFHSFAVCPAPTVPIIDPGSDPTLPHLDWEYRVSEAAFSLLFDEMHEKAPADNLWSNYLWVKQQAQEGGGLYNRLEEIKSKVSSLLIPQPTLADLRRKVPDVS